MRVGGGGGGGEGVERVGGGGRGVCWGGEGVWVAFGEVGGGG